MSDDWKTIAAKIRAASDRKERFEKEGEQETARRIAEIREAVHAGVHSLRSTLPFVSLAEAGQNRQVLKDEGEERVEVEYGSKTVRVSERHSDRRSTTSKNSRDFQLQLNEYDEWVWADKKGNYPDLSAFILELFLRQIAKSRQIEL